MLVMYKPWLRYSRLEDKLYDDWVGRMEGQSGCWVASEEEEAPLVQGGENPLELNQA